MASTIKLKNSTTAGNSPSSLSQGEVAINVADGGLFYGTTGGTSVSSSLSISHLTASGNISSSGNIFGDSIRASSGFVGTITTAAQPNITSVGTLTGLNVNGNITASGKIVDSTFSSDSLLNLHDDNVVNANGVTLSSIGSMVIMLDSNNTGTVDKLEFRADSQDASAGNLLATIEDNGDFSAEGNITASGNISASGNLIGTQLDVNGFAGAVKVTSGDTGNLFAINNIDTLNLGKLGNLTTTNLVGSLNMSQPDAGHITASGNIRGTMPQIISANMGSVNLSTENFIPLAEGELEGTNGEHPRVNLVAPFSGSLRRVVMRSNAAFGTAEFTASLHTIRPGGTLTSDKDTVGQCFVNTAAANNAYAVVFDFANSVVGSNVIDGGDRVLIGVETTRTNSQNYYFTSVFTWDYQETTGLQTTSTSTSGGSI